MKRLVVTVSALVLASALLPGCSKLQRRSQSAAHKMRESVRTAGGALYDRVNDAVQTMDAAMNGCSIEQRDAFDLDSLEEYHMGRIVSAEHIAALGVKDLGPTHPVSIYVDNVGQFVTMAAEVYGEQNVRERSRVPEKVLDNRPSPYGGYHFIVLEREDPNAFGGPGGVVMITTGLLRKLQSEDELAAVLAHEVAHVQRGHGVEVMKAFMCKHAHAEKASAPLRKAAEIGDQVGDKVEGRLRRRGLALKNADKGVLTELVDSISDRVSALYSAGYPREFELEADRIAIRYLEVAGYEPAAIRSVFDRLQKDSPDDDYGRTHPSFERRLAVVDPMIKTIPEERRSPLEDIALRAGRYAEVMKQLPAPAEKKQVAETK